MQQAASTLPPADRFEHRPAKFVGVATPRIVYIGIADRADFDKIAVPCQDRGPTENGHVLVKTVAQDGVEVIFQHWLLSLTLDATMADMRARRAQEAHHAAAS